MLTRNGTPALYRPGDTLEHAYHDLRWRGVPKRAAIRRLGVPSPTVRCWERRLRLDAAAAIGRPLDDVDYLLAVRCLFDWPALVADLQAAENPL